MTRLSVFLFVIFLSTKFIFPQSPENYTGGVLPGVICGNDDRTAFWHNAVGRILGYAANGAIVEIGTGFIAQNGKLISARHVYADGINALNPAVTWVIEFNVPASGANGQLNHPIAENIYTINTNTHVLGTQDYWIFDVELNSVTGEHPFIRQGTSLTVDLNPTIIDEHTASIYGYGKKLNTSLHHVLQFSSGLVKWVGNDESDVRYEIDTDAGSSGAPVIQSSLVKAIHREGNFYNGLCNNYGTMTNAEGFALAFNQPWTYKTVTLDQTKANSNIFVGILNRWWNNNFLAYTSKKILLLKTGADIVLGADPSIIDNNKFHSFNDGNNLQRIMVDQIPGVNHQYKSTLDEVKSGIVINNSIEGVSGLNYGSINFRDPWYLQNSPEYNIPPYGYSNLGNNAIYHARTTPFNPKTTGSDIGKDYKGVFLNQGNDWQPPYYSVNATGDQYLTMPSSGRSHYFRFLGWQANPSVGATFQYPTQTETPIVFKQDNTTVSALYKGIQLSNNPATYSNNGQQHFVRVKNTYFYSAYESMGKLFIEEKMAQNVPWDLWNYSKPVIEEPVFSSSMDFLNNGVNEHDMLLLAYTTQYSSGYPYLTIRLLNGTTHRVYQNDSFSWDSDNAHSPSEFQPVVAVNGSTKFMIVFRRMESDKKGLFFCPGTIIDTTITIADSSYYPWYIHGTNQYSVNPTISVSKTASNAPVYWIAWQQNSPTGSSSDIYYKQITVHSNSSFSQYGGMMSGGSGYPWNRYPTITSIGNSARVAWQGYVGFIEDGMNKTGADEMEESRIIFKSTDWWQYWQFGYNVHKPNINRHDAENGYIFGWSQNGGQGIYFANNTTLSTISTVTGLQGYDVQISNGTDKSSMVANSYKTTQQPYFFTSSNGLSSFMKEQNLRIGSGREGIIRKEDVIFKYLVGDISRNGQEIAFKEIPDTINLNSLSVINSYLETEPFIVNSNTELIYSVGFMVSDSVLASGVLSQEDEIKFTLTINDAVSGSPIAVLDEVIYTKSALGNYGSIAFRATMEGMPETHVIIKLTVQSNFDHISSLARRVNFGDVIEKSSTKTIAVKSPLIITEYSLSQNYPNPFNPATEIEFALPEKSDITLKVYDILGTEIITLAAGSYESGRYTIPFDGSNFASGVYIYKLSYGKGQSITRKMTLLK